MTIDLRPVPTLAGVADVAATYVRQVVAEQPDLSVIFPTGRTPIGLYQRLVAAHGAGDFDLSRATVFMLDEYLNLPTYPVGSFHHFLIEHLGPVIDNSHTTWHTISPSNDPAWSTAYDALIDAAGGIDLAIVGIGQNGHIGFNEPGAHPSWRSHVVTLEASTLDVNFPETSPDQRPTTALTMGMADLIAARRVLLLASGANKAAVLRTLLEGIDDPHIPATFLRDHPNLTVIADGAALASV